jgi:hypothetical protein
MNLASGRCRGESCTRPGAASRVAAWELLVWSPPVHRFEDWADERLEVAQWLAWRCPVNLGSYSTGDDAAVPRMAAQ